MIRQPAGLLPRAGVSRALEQALSSPLTVLTAPMGYGKTTAARAFAEQTARPALYLTAPQGADSVRYLWDTLCVQLAAQGWPPAALLREMGFPRDSVGMDRALRHIREYRTGDPILLVVDDYHFADFPQFNVFLEHLIKADMTGLNILLVSRNRPGLPLEELRIKGMARLLGRELLAFSREEAVAYYALHGINDAGAALAAWKDCEGWAAAMWLSVRGYRADAGAAPARDVESLLGRVIFPAYAPEDRRLLIQLSILDSFTPEQAALISGDESAPRRLKILHEHNAFLKYDPAADSYGLHSIFRSFLGRQPRKEYGIDAALLHRRAGEVFAAAGDPVLAARFFFKAGRDEDLLRILELFESPQNGWMLFLARDEIIPIMLSMPWRLRFQRPMGHMAFIYFYLAEVSVPKAMPLLEEAEERFLAEPGIPEALKKRIKGEAILMRGLPAFNDLWAMRDIHVAAHGLLNGRSSISARHLIWTFGCPHAAYLYLREPGSYADMIDLVENNLHYFQDLSDGCSMGAELLFRAEYLLETGNFDEVGQILRAAVRRAESREQMTTILAAEFSRARLLAATGRGAEAAALLQDWTPKIHALGHADLTNCLELALGYVNACLNRPQAIPVWLRDGHIAPSRDIPQILGFIHLVHGKAVLQSGDYAALDSVARSLPAFFGPFNNLFGRLHAKIMEAVAARRLHGPEKALALMAEALELSRPDGIVLSIAEYGGHVLPMLKDLRDENGGDAYLDALLEHAERLGRARAAARTGALKRQGLTPRQEELLRLAALGKSNAAIAACLGISPVTASKTLSSAYAKLKAKNRAEAVRKFLAARQ